MTFFRTVSALIVAVSVASCATTYGEPGLMGGVKATPLSKDTFAIIAGGNSWVSLDTMREFALLKAAETTLSAGATHFEILNTANKSENLPVYAGGVFMTQQKPGVEITIKTHASADAANLQDANQIVQTLGPKLKSKS